MANHVCITIRAQCVISSSRAPRRVHATKRQLAVHQVRGRAGLKGDANALDADRTLREQVSITVGTVDVLDTVPWVRSMGSMPRIPSTPLNPVALDAMPNRLLLDNEARGNRHTTYK